MNRISTAGNYQSALLNLMSAQARQADAQMRIATQKNATDLAGFGRSSESLTSMKAAQSRIQGFVSAGETATARLDAQDLAMTRIGDALTSASSAMGNAIANDSGVTLMLEIDNAFRDIVGGLNTRHNGDYLFSGSRTDTPAVNVATLADLAAAPDVASTFQNDALAATSRLSEGAPTRTGILANDVGSAVFQIFRDIKAYSDDPVTGPLTGKLTDTQKAFLTTKLQELQAASGGVTTITASNGSLSKQVATMTASNTAQANALEELVANRTDADMAKAITDLELAQVAIQASAQVVSGLSEVSLLNYLR
jgi:flagellar hook-associated protein 3 FlgL